jgi:hypothetical protein
MKIDTMKRTGAAVLGAGALVAMGLAGAGVASAAEAPKGATIHWVSDGPGEATSNHVSSWQTTHVDGDDWSANVRVDYGRSGAITRCSDGSVKYGPSQGPGYWIFAGNCYGNGSLTGYGYYNA